jgi:hypothetical protein
MDHLPLFQFQSYLAHEYAHHVYGFLWGEKDPSWVREGWARLLQWKIVQQLQGPQERPEYLHHALVQIIGELKFACLLVSGALGVKLPWKVRMIRTIYQRNPLVTFLTGTPLTNVASLAEHAVGTAVYFMADDRYGARHALMQNPGNRRRSREQ